MGNDTIESVQPPKGKPKWLRVKLPTGKKYTQLRGLVEKYDLHTICTSGSCPQYGGVLGRGHGYFHDFGKYLYKILRFLWGEDR